VTLQYDLDPDEWKPVIDEGNVRWREIPLRKHYKPHREDGHYVWPVVKDDELDAAIVEDFPMLKGHDYQALWYREIPRGLLRTLDGELCILIDRNTGEVLIAVNGGGRVLTPQPVEGILSKREFIDIATAAGPRYGFDSEKWKAILDTFSVRTNMEWDFYISQMIPKRDKNGYFLDDRAWRKLVSVRWPVLKDRNYQALYYVPAGEEPDPVFGYYDFQSKAEGWILIDRRTGEVILVVDRQGQTLTPESGSESKKTTPE
jgi:hypothetical protein